MLDSRRGRRVAIVAGLRTPFARSGTVFRDVTAVALARHAARELLYRSELDGQEVDEVIVQPGGPLGAHAQRGARGESPAPVSAAPFRPIP